MKKLLLLVAFMATVAQNVLAQEKVLCSVMVMKSNSSPSMTIVE